ncbi:hypothetical protein PINS_up024257 [Pythium insidiosum]|nr:hypothetical protein PINS_up024257 [Pythium insidiosum]
MDNWKSSPSCRGVAVLGSYGVGKSTCCVYMFLRLMLEKRDLAFYLTRMHNLQFFSFNNESGRYDVYTFPQEGKAYYGLFDDREWNKVLPSGYRCHLRHTLLFTAPGSESHRDFAKTRYCRVFLNPWSKAECQAFFDKANLVGRENWVAFYNLVGGIPLYVLAQLEELSALAVSVQNALPDSIAELEEQITRLREQVVNDRRLHYVYSFYRTPTGYAVFPSTAVDAMLRSRFKSYSAAKLYSHLGVGADEMSLWQTLQPEKFQLQALTTKPFVVKAVCTLEGGRTIQYGECTEYGPLQAPIKTFTVPTEIRDDLALYLSLSATSGQIDGVLVVPQLVRALYITTTVSRNVPLTKLESDALYQHLKKRKEFRNYRHIQLIVVRDTSVKDWWLVFDDELLNRSDVTSRTAENRCGGSVAVAVVSV